MNESSEIVGRSSIVPRDAWDANIEDYTYLDAVEYQGDGYLGKNENTIIPKGTLPTDVNYWQLYVRGGGNYNYYGYASNSNGDNFSLIASDSLRYQAQITSGIPLVPTESDFAGAAWIKYIGDGIEDYTNIKQTLVKTPNINSTSYGVIDVIKCKMNVESTALPVNFAIIDLNNKGVSFDIISERNWLIFAKDSLGYIAVDLSGVYYNNKIVRFLFDKSGFNELDAGAGGMVINTGGKVIIDIIDKSIGLVNIEANGTTYQINASDYTTVVSSTIGVSSSVLGDILENLRLGTNDEYKSRYSVLLDKKISVLGDSISDGEHGTGVDLSTVWHGLIKNRLGINDIYVDAVSGSPVTGTAIAPLPFVTAGRWDELDTNFDPDIILIFGGTNDFAARNRPLGNLSDPEAINDTSYVSGLKYLYHNVAETYPKAKIFHMIPLHRSVATTFPEFNSATGNYLYEFINFTKSIASDYGISIINLFSESGLTYWNMNADNYADDGLHPDANGHELIFEKVINELLNMY